MNRFIGVQSAGSLSLITPRWNSGIVQNVPGIMNIVVNI